MVRGLTPPMVHVGAGGRGEGGFCLGVKPLKTVLQCHVSLAQFGFAIAKAPYYCSISLLPLRVLASPFEICTSPAAEKQVSAHDLEPYGT